MLFKKSQCKVDSPQVVCSEYQNKHILNNPTRINIYKYKIDGDILTEKDGEKCDYIVEVDTRSKPTAFVIEFKGSDLEKAISQIDTTIKRFNLTRTHSVQPRIIIHKARTQQVNGSTYRDFKKRYPNVIVKEKLLEETIR